MKSLKTDNHNPKAKLDLRRHFLNQYPGPFRVMDCCAGDSVLWKNLRAEFEIESYWAIDKKRKKGRMTVDSSRILEVKGWSENVIDIDTYGSPWKHWFAMLPNIRQPVSCFLTI